MRNIEETLKDYIKEKGGQEGIRIPLSQMAEELDCSTATVWRTVQKIKEKRIVKIVKSLNKTEPDKMYYIGEGKDLDKTIDALVQSTEGILLVLKELKGKINEM